MDHIIYALWISGVSTGILAAWFKLHGTWHSAPEDRELLRQRYGRLWSYLQGAKYMHLAELGVKWLVRQEEKPGQWSQAFFDLIERRFDNEVIQAILFCCPGAVALAVLYNGPVGVTAFVIALCLVFLEIFDIGLKERLQNLLYFFAGAYAFISCAAILQVALTLAIHWSALILLSVAPLYLLLTFWASHIVGISTAMLVAWIGESTLRAKRRNRDLFLVYDPYAFTNLGFAMVVSFSVTAAALALGSLFSQGAPVPRTIQMFLVNVLCDGFTLVATFEIMKRAVSRDVRTLGMRTVTEKRRVERSYPVPVAIAIDLTLASTLAVMSLYLGLRGSSFALTLPESCRVLIGLAPDAAKIELGPYFWVMHTTFLPTLTYMTVIGFFYLGRVLTLPVFHMLRKGRELEMPHELTAASFAFIAVTLLALAKILEKSLVKL